MRPWEVGICCAEPQVAVSDFFLAGSPIRLSATIFSDERFTSVTLWGTEIGDGIFFDNLYYD
jgi:hypothetical protein